MLKDPKGTTHLLPLVHTEDPVGVVAVLANAVQLDGVTPGLAQVLTCGASTALSTCTHTPCPPCCTPGAARAL